MKGKDIKKNIEKDFAVGNCYDYGAKFCIQTWSGAKKLCMDTLNVFLLYYRNKA